MPGYRKACPVPGCARTVSEGKLMCPKDWGAVPPDLQKAVHRTWRAWRRDLGNAELMQAYREASDAAIGAV